jgi:hypothetical protein
LCRTSNRLRNRFLGDVGQVEAHLGPFGDSVNLGPDRSTDCVEHTIGSEIILDTPGGTPS